jgi:putative endonuclease
MQKIFPPDIENNETSALSTSEVGELGEKLAADFLTRNGYQMVMANFKVPVGRNRRGVAVTGEIDIIALDDETVCFVEVKTRSSDDFAAPISAVDNRKQRQIIRAARVYRKVFNLNKIKFRYDAVSIVLNNKKAPKIEHFKGFWTEDKFRKKYWADEF